MTFTGDRIQWWLGVMVALFGLVPAWEGAVSAQDTDASIIGQVTDESGAVLPGVTVAASSPALQVGEMSVVTNERGEYRITPLPIGTYAVAYTLSGFQTYRREGIRLTAGFSAKLDTQMKLGIMAETITVSGQSPVVDTTSTATTTQLTRETLELTPSGRNGLYALAAQVPGVRSNAIDVGGSSMNSTITFRAYGQVADTWQTLEGVMTTSPKASQSGNYYDYASMEEAQMQVIGKTAEVPVRGVQMAIITKSGSNNFRGGGTWAQTNDKFQSANKSPVGAEKIENRDDLSGELGGRVIPSKLWFYGSGRDRRETADVLAAALKPDGTPATHNQHQSFETNKISYQLTPGNKLIGFYNWQLKHELRNVTQFLPWETRTDENFRAYTGKIEWQAVHGSSLVTSLQYGYWKWHADYYATSGKPFTTDLVTKVESGDNPDAGNVPGEWRHHVTGNVSWYRPGVWGGNHDIKAGFDYLAATISRAWISRASPVFGQPAGGNYQLIFSNGVPTQIATYNYPVVPVSQSHYLGTYVRDNWTIKRRLTLNLGVRYVPHDQGFIPAQCRVDAEPAAFAPAQCNNPVNLFTWKSVAPRLAASYDLTGNGKTVVKGGWGRYDHMREIEEVLPLNRNIASTTTWKWHAPIGATDYVPGEVNLDPNGPDFVSVTTRDTGLFSNGVLNPNEKEPKVDQFNASIERELMPNFGVRITGIHTRSFNVYRFLNTSRPYGAYNVPVTVTDPGPDGIVGTADDPGRTITFYDYPASLVGLKFQTPELYNDPGSLYYNTVELAATKRLSNHWQMMASYSATKLNEPFQEDSNLSPIADLQGGSGGVTAGAAPQHYWEWLGRVSGAYIFPHDISLALNYDHRSGAAQAREILVNAPQSGSTLINAGPIGSLRLPNTNVVDFRIEKTFRLRNQQKIAGRINLYNLTNANTTTARVIQSGASFMTPTAAIRPRILDFGATYSF
jgi:carboxypeptidase family protein